MATVRRIRPKLSLKNIKFKNPQFNVEWNEISDAKRGEQTTLDDFFNLGRTKWIALAKKGRMVKYNISQAKNIENTDAGNPKAFHNLLPIKQERSVKQIFEGVVELSIVANWSDGYKFLIGGNTRLTAMMNIFGEGYAWQFNVPDQE